MSDQKVDTQKIAAHGNEAALIGGQPLKHGTCQKNFGELFGQFAPKTIVAEERRQDLGISVQIRYRSCEMAGALQ
jgi:hypothetical protein